jgi:hypothetical protein
MGSVYAEKLKVYDCDSFLNQTLFWYYQENNFVIILQWLSI